jgi:hypothetical protein
MKSLDGFLVIEHFWGRHIVLLSFASVQYDGAQRGDLASSTNDPPKTISLQRIRHPESPGAFFARIGYEDILSTVCKSRQVT